MAPFHSPWTWTRLYFGSNAFSIHEVDWRLQVALDYANWRIHLSFDVDALDPSVTPSAGTPDGSSHMVCTLLMNGQVSNGQTISSYMKLFRVKSNVKSTTSTHQNSAYGLVFCGFQRQKDIQSSEH
ncbi:hypothetical protein F4604DRAFT_1906425 [Suillus subluteus]|nr:hypothetical protein F4604DRAFT_1906425 [Suillus subluteus]